MQEPKYTPYATDGAAPSAPSAPPADQEHQHAIYQAQPIQNYGSTVPVVYSTQQPVLATFVPAQGQQMPVPRLLPRPLPQPKPTPSRASLITLLVLQGIFSIISISNGSRGGSQALYLLGFTAIVTIILSWIGIAKSHSGVLFVNMAIMYTAAFFVSIYDAVFILDFVQKCHQNMDLYLRFTSVSLGHECVATALIIALVSGVVLLEFALALATKHYMKALIKLDTLVVYKQPDNAINSNNGDGRNTNDGEPLLVKPDHEFGLILKIFTISICIGLLTGAVFLTFRPMHRSLNAWDVHEPPNQCLVGSDFLPRIMVNELQCCSWHNDATCCKRKDTCKDLKQFSVPLFAPDFEECSKLVGLLNCAPCRFDSCTFAANMSGGVERICKSFCSELYYACNDDMWPLSSATAWCESTFQVKVLLDPGSKYVPDCSKQGCFGSSSGFEKPSVIFIFVLCLLSFIAINI